MTICYVLLVLLVAVLVATITSLYNLTILLFTCHNNRTTQNSEIVYLTVNLEIHATHKLTNYIIPIGV